MSGRGSLKRGTSFSGLSAMQRTQIVNGTLFKLMEQTGDSFGTDRLELGDLVIIGTINSEGNLGGIVDADGFFSEAVQPLSEDKTDSKMFFDSLFRVTPALQYDAQTEQERAEKRPSMNLNRLSSSGSFLGTPKAKQKSIQRELDNFRAQATDEITKNELKMRRLKEGDLVDVEVLYGDEIQFEHVATGKFLCAGPSELRVVTRGNQVRSRPCVMSTYRSSRFCTRLQYSTFRLSPRFRFRDEGDPVLYAGTSFESFSSAKSRLHRDSCGSCLLNRSSSPPVHHA